MPGNDTCQGSKIGIKKPLTQFVPSSWQKKEAAV